MYRKSTHTGQCSHYSSFTPWSRKIAWLRSLVQCAQKICSIHDLLNSEILKIKRFASWNGFPRWSVNKLIKTFTTNPSESRRTNEAENIPAIWIKLPFIGKKGCSLVRNCTSKISRLINKPVKFVTHWQTVNASTFVSFKDPVPKPYKNSVVYQFSCPGCC